MVYNSKKVIRTDSEEKIAIAILKNIENDWKNEAKLEDIKYFYSYDLVEQIKNGKKCFILGRKGTGKTAISTKLSNNFIQGSFSKKITFQNFPFNEIYSKEDQNYPVPKQYTSIWKYLIYNSVCELMAQNQGIDSNVSVNLLKLYKGIIDSNDALISIVRNITSESFGISLKDFGINLSKENKDKKVTTWIEKKDAFERIIKQYGGNYTYYILIDELDEDYRKFSNETEKNKYFEFLTGLFKAVQDIRSIFIDSDTRVFPIVFLRDDIYSQIRDSDKNKWKDYCSTLTWRKEDIKELLSYRISIASDRKINIANAWNFIVPDDSIFEYISRLSQLRPRDFISYIKYCAEYANKVNQSYISKSIVYKCEPDYSEHLFGELVDELHVQFPEIERLLSSLSLLHRNIFNFDDFMNCYSGQFERNETKAKEVLNFLYDFGVIGNFNKDGGYPVFKYRKSKVLLNINDSLIIHSGLCNVLQIPRNQNDNT